MENEQTFRATGKNLVKLAIPLIGTHLANVALGITDTVMMGWYSIPALAALVLGNAYFFVFFFVWCWIFFCSSASCCLDFKCRRDNPCQTIHAYGVMVIANICNFNSTIIFQCRSHPNFSWTSE